MVAQSSERLGVVVWSRWGAGVRRWAGRLVALVLAGVLVAVLVAPSGRVQAGAVMRPATNGVAALARVGSLPVQAQSVISAALGSGATAFAARRSGVGWRLAGGGVRARFWGRGVDLLTGGGSLSIALDGLGRDRRLGAPGPVSVSARANRVVYDRGGVREWYAAGPLGIEQGFMLVRRPAGTRGPLTLALRLGGALRAQVSGSEVWFVTGSGRVALRYGGLVALDASGRRLPAALELRGGRLVVRVDDRRARYPLRIDPLIQQGSKLTANDESGPGEFG